MNRITKVIIGAILVAYGVYSQNQWFYLGVIPLMMGICDKCPLSGCKDGNCDVNNSSSKDEKQENTNVMNFSSVKPSTKEIITIKILGSGCSNCTTLYNTVNESIKQIDGNFEVTKVEEVEEIMKYSVISTPGLVINEEVKSTGRILNVQEVIDLIKGNKNECCTKIKTKCCGK
jgi:small redox-active disulfide protein 2